MGLDRLAVVQRSVVIYRASHFIRARFECMNHESLCTNQNQFQSNYIVHASEN